MRQKPYVAGAIRLRMRYDGEIQQRYQCRKCGVRYWAPSNIVAHLQRHLIDAWRELWDLS